MIQRSASGLNVNPHFHTLALDGVFRTAASGALEFDPAPAPSDDEVAQLLGLIHARVGRLLQRLGLAPEDDATGPVDRLGDESPLLAGLVSGSVQGRVTLGARAGRRVRRLGDEADAEDVMSRGPRQAHLDGFDLHANVWVAANDRAGLERLCRYVQRPPFAQERGGRCVGFPEEQNERPSAAGGVTRTALDAGTVPGYDAAHEDGQIGRRGWGLMCAVPPGFGDRRRFSALLSVTLAGAEGDRAVGRRTSGGFMSPILSWTGICPGNNESAGNASRARRAKAIAGYARP